GVESYKEKAESTPRVQEEEISPTPSVRGLADQALAQAVEAGDRLSEVVALTDLGFIEMSEGDANGAIATLAKSLTLAYQLGNRSRIAETLGNLAAAFLMFGQNRQAIDLIERGLAEAREIGDRFAEKYLLEHRGKAEANLGYLETAQGFFEQA